ncbi:VWA domain-containing protein [Thiomicrorhabdus arctica]|uniref:VWA domain-containing protein n=1 Tax=Thiomicrorhabdus arctica TaxID=131540 RepID=UPI00035FE8ED|nr:VWA domain-containing protein [Thiomicrorhabdus arctica]
MDFFSQDFFDVFGLFLQGDIAWRAPNWLWALLLPILWWVLKQFGQKQHQQAYADSHLWPWIATENTPIAAQNDSLTATSAMNSSILTKTGLLRRAIRSLAASIGSFVNSPSRLITLGWLCLIIALAGPRSLISAPDLQSREGVDILVSMDLSQSMNASDVYPSRFLFAKSLIESMSFKLQMGDRLALQGFAGQAFMVSPLSYDRDLFRHSLNLLEPGLLPIQGSRIELAVIGGLTHLSQTAGKAKVMVLFTNGAPQFWQPVELPKSAQQSKFAELQKLSDTGVKIILVGVGKPVATTLPDREHKSGKLHANGLLVQSRLEESSLKKMAQNVQGVYLRADASKEFMTRLLKEMTLPAASRTQPQENQLWRDYAWPFMLLGLLLLLMAFYLLGLFKSFAGQFLQSKASKEINGLVGLSGALVLLLLQSFPQPGFAQTPAADEHHSFERISEAYRAYTEGNYELSRSLYDQNSSFSGWFGAGSAAYKLNEFESAIAYFRQAAWTAIDDENRSKALFNLGNSYYQTNLLALAIESYQQALRYRKAYTKAEHNLSLALQRKTIEDLAQQQDKEKKAEGEDDGGSGRESEGAFYGGQKPNASNNNEPGFGTDGDAPKGNKSGDLTPLPNTGDETNYRLSRGSDKMAMNRTNGSDSRATAILNHLQQRKRADQFEYELQLLEDDQKTLLKRMFEREAGFHAAQSEAHPIPGIQPW